VRGPTVLRDAYRRVIVDEAHAERGLPCDDVHQFVDLDPRYLTVHIRWRGAGPGAPHHFTLNLLPSRKSLRNVTPQFGGDRRKGAAIMRRWG
jgi:hypothetical protein